MADEVLMKAEIDNLREKVSGLETALASGLADVRAELRVVKHDQNNMGQIMQGMVVRLDKFEDRLIGEMKEVRTDVSKINVKHERGMGFFAGMAFLLSMSGGFLLLLGKLLFAPPAS